AQSVHVSVGVERFHRERRHELAGVARAVAPGRELARRAMERDVHSLHPVEKRWVEPDADKENGVARDLPDLEAVALALDHRLEEQRDHASRVFEFRRRDERGVAADVREHDRPFPGLMRIRRETISRHAPDYRPSLTRSAAVRTRPRRNDSEM